MMLTYAEVKKKPSRFLSITGLTIAEFEALLPSFEQAWDADIEQRLANQKRMRKVGGGRKPVLVNNEARLLFILVYFKLYLLQETQGLLFGLSQSQTNEWIHRLTPILRAALGREKILPERDPDKVKEVLSEYLLLSFTVDGTERRLQRPLDSEEQKEYYSGKKKAHTLKNDVIAHTETGKVCFLSQTYPGKTHDKRICDEEGYSFPHLAELAKDTGFQGYEPVGVISYQPKKKPRGGQLTTGERFFNSVIASLRISVENILCGVKRCRIVKDIFRNHRKGFTDSVMEIACGLHNLRVHHRHPIPHFDLLELCT
jgi:hypothetical protein